MTPPNKTPSPKAEGNVDINTRKPTGRKLTRQQKWRRKNPRAYLAHLALANAIRLGVVQKQPCAVCGDPKAEAHHPSYSRPFDVQWLCRRHHRQLHAGKAVRP